MRIEFDNPKHEGLVNDHVALSKKFDRRGKKVSVDILATLNVLRDAPSLAEVPRAFRPHPLKAEWKGFFAADVDDKGRVIFKPKHAGDPNYRIDNHRTITSITVVEIYKDYH